jgi:thiamine kinase-like enzyme
MSDTQIIQSALEAIPPFAKLKPADYKATRLGGLTNLVFKLETVRDGNLILRVPGQGTSEYIDRAVEMHNARSAADADVSAKVLYGDPQSGLMVTRCIDDIVTMTGDLFRTRAGSPARAGRAFKQLHTRAQEFRFRFELFSMIENYLKVLSTKDLTLPEGYHDVVAAADPIKAAIASKPVTLAPCHCDPLAENFLDDGKRMWMVDWEYSGMNDPMWDLGDLSVEAGFSGAQDNEMMAAYFDDKVPAPAFARMVIYKAMCDLLWTLWGLLQFVNKNPADDFWAYSVNRLDRCRALMREPDFNGHVRTIARG